MELFVFVPLLIIDDLGMRKLPMTAAEDLLEIVMRRYERASTLLTSNRPVDDWGKLLGDSAAVTAMLDRLLHHGHVLKCGYRVLYRETHKLLDDLAEATIGCVEVDAAYCGLPPGWIGREVNVQWDELYVRILDPQNGLLLREHVRQKCGWYRINKEDRPQHMPLQVSQLLWRAGRAGSHIGTLCNLIYSQLGEAGIRRILGVLSLAKKFGAAAVEDACAAALEMGMHEYRFVRRYLERAPQLTLRQVGSQTLRLAFSACNSTPNPVSLRWPVLRFSLLLFP
jgi:hypothetical protein